MRTALLAVVLAAGASRAEAPMSLTASDGTGLTLVSITARAVVEDPLAFTELKLVFQNPQDRVIEGQFKVTLPRGAVVSRFAMKLDDRWQEGEVVEKQAARRAYEDFLHRRQDPALLEQGAANEFQARVFPIPARGVKELILSYSQDLPGSGAPWVLPLKGLPQVGALDAQVFAEGKLAASLDKKGWTPDRDLTLAPAAQGRAGLRSGELLVARVKPIPETAPESMMSVTFLVDTSASRALGFNAQLALLKALTSKLAGKAGLTVIAFDQTAQEIFSGPAGAFGDKELKALKDRKALGASDLQGALKAVGSQSRVVLLSDGVATAGDVTGDLLMAAVKGLKAKGVERLDAVGVGGLRDDATLKQLVTAGLARDGAVIDGDLGAEAVFKKLSASTKSGLAVAVEGAKFVWPQKLDGVQAGDEVLIYAEVPAGAAVKLTVGGKPVDLSKGVASVERPLLERALVQARIAAIADRIDRAADGPKEKGELKAQAIALSTKFRVLSPWTALLVLETEQDYARFNIDRRALADIVTVKDGRIALTQRKADAVVVAQKPPPQPKQDKPESEKASFKKKAADEGGAPARPAKTAQMDLEEADGVEAKKEEAPERSDAPGAPPPPRAEAPRPSPRPAEVAAAEPAPEPARESESNLRRAPSAPSARPPAQAAPWEAQGTDPYTGQLKSVMDAIKAKDLKKAQALAWGWREEQPGDVLALIALGEVLEAGGDAANAARVYGSMIDLFPARADLRRFAGVRLERLAKDAGLKLAADSFAKAAEQRADHPASHRLLAFALVKLGQYEKAFLAMEKGVAQRYPDGRFRGVDQILKEDLGLIAAAWIKAEPARKQEILGRVARLGGRVEAEPSLRFVLNWETDANDVDFHIADSKGGHAFYSSKHLPSGGDLYADVTTGYGPECFTIRGPAAARAYPYRLSAQYYSRGPMGYGMGKLQIIEHDGAGKLSFTERPYVVMVDQAFVDLGKVEK